MLSKSIFLRNIFSEESIRKVLSGESIRDEVAYPQSDGSMIWFNIILKPVINDEGVIVRILFSIHDISYRKTSEERLLLQNKKLLEIAVMQSHQVRAPIATILGLINLFNFNDPNDPANTEVLAMLKKAVKSFDDIIRNIVKMTYEIEKIKLSDKNSPGDTGKKAGQHHVI